MLSLVKVDRDQLRSCKDSEINLKSSISLHLFRPALNIVRVVPELLGSVNQKKNTSLKTSLTFVITDRLDTTVTSLKTVRDLIWQPPAAA